MCFFNMIGTGVNSYNSTIYHLMPTDTTLSKEQDFFQ